MKYKDLKQIEVVSKLDCKQNIEIIRHKNLSEDVQSQKLQHNKKIKSFMVSKKNNKQKQQVDVENNKESSLIANDIGAKSLCAKNLQEKNKFEQQGSVKSFKELQQDEKEINKKERKQRAFEFFLKRLSFSKSQKEFFLKAVFQCVVFSSLLCFLFVVNAIFPNSEMIEQMSSLIDSEHNVVNQAFENLKDKLPVGKEIDLPKTVYRCEKMSNNIKIYSIDFALRALASGSVIMLGESKNLFYLQVKCFEDIKLVYYSTEKFCVSPNQKILQNQVIAMSEPFSAVVVEFQNHQGKSIEFHLNNNTIEFV